MNYTDFLEFFLLDYLNDLQLINNSNNNEKTWILTFIFLRLKWMLFLQYLHIVIFLLQAELLFIKHRVDEIVYSHTI